MNFRAGCCWILSHPMERHPSQSLCVCVCPTIHGRCNPRIDRVMLDTSRILKINWKWQFLRLIPGTHKVNYWAGQDSEGCLGLVSDAQVDSILVHVRTAGRTQRARLRGYLSQHNSYFLQLTEIIINTDWTYTKKSHAYVFEVAVGSHISCNAVHTKPVLEVCVLCVHACTCAS